MIHFFSSPEHANGWMEGHPEWKPVAVSAGHISGSVLVLFQPQAFRIESVKPPQIELRIDEAAQIEYIAEVKRRGRPPKVKDA